MRLSVVSCALVGVLGASTGAAQRGADNTAAVDRACTVTDCFLEREIRDFEVIDRTHVIVYAGSQRCAFHVEVTGTLCDLTFAPELYFQRANELPDGRLFGGSDDPFDPLNVNRRGRSSNLRICANDLSIEVHGGRFTEPASSTKPPDRFGNARAECQVSGVTSLTDDQLVEFYVARGVVPPPPPMGSGEIEVGEQDEPEGESAAPEEQGAPPEAHESD